MTQTVLNRILQKHEDWLQEKENGEKADLRGADLRYADLSGVKNLLNAINFISSHFERTDEGYIVYKTFNSLYAKNPNWENAKSSVIEEVVNHTRTQSCGCGINVAPLNWVVCHTPRVPIYQILIKFEWLTEVCVPYSSNGKIRCGRAMIVKALTKEEEEEVLNNGKLD